MLDFQPFGESSFHPFLPTVLCGERQAGAFPDIFWQYMCCTHKVRLILSRRETNIVTHYDYSQKKHLYFNRILVLA